MSAMVELNDSIRKIAHGTVIAAIGMVMGQVFNFVARLLIARYNLPSDYGVFSLALAILTLAMALGTLGLRQGATRYIAFFRGKGDAAKVHGAVYASLKLSFIASVCLGVIVFFIADILAIKIFHISDLAIALKIFAVGIPFLTLINVLAAIFCGFDRIGPQVYFEYIMLNILFFVALVVVVSTGMPFVTILLSYLSALVITFTVFAIYTIRRLPRSIGLLDVKAAAPITKDLLLFSLPLLGVIMLTMIMNWINTLMLGYFKLPVAVGLYNAAYPLAQFIIEPLVALLLIYVPIATGLYSQNKIYELRRNYTVLTKWLVFITLPLFLVLFLFPEAVLLLFFGRDYMQAAIALRILSFGFIISNILGPNRGTLIAMGHARFLMWTTLATVALNVILNIFLIPRLGVAGAATASVISIVLMNVIRSAKLYLLCRVQPLSKNLFKPAVVCVILAFLIEAVAQNFLTITWWVLLLLFILYCGIYGLATLFTRSFDEEDIAMLLEIESRSGINAAPVKRILGRFL